jgi:23S rRNA (cytidine1920-2'-O)/16S rRNA (cytidine1409-2'-O)-methyltransferase
VRRRLVTSRTEAAAAIAAGRVRVAGVPSPKPSTLVAPEAPLAIDGPPSRFVGRGGVKLDAALDRFGVDVAGTRAVDVGASTGGFTDCLLQRGATSVTAVDVGYGQLDWSLRTDPRVIVVERTNVRTADPAALGAPFDVVVADLSFISLATVAPALAALAGPDAVVVVLVKPQFEVGKGKVGKGGIVRDPALHASAISDAAAALEDAGLGAADVMASPIEGASGNREFLLLARPGPSRLDAAAIDAVVAR